MTTLLFADDDPFILRMLEDTFQKLGYEVLTASCADDAIDLIPRADLVVTDWRMPIADDGFGDEGGLIVLAQAKKLKKAVVVYSGTTQDPRMKSATRVVQKPGSKALLEAVFELAGRPASVVADEI